MCIYTISTISTIAVTSTRYLISVISFIYWIYTHYIYIYTHCLSIYKNIYYVLPSNDMARFNPFEGLPPKSGENTTGSVCIWGKKSIPSQNANVDLENHLSIIIYITIMGVGAQGAQGVQRCSEMFRVISLDASRIIMSRQTMIDDVC